jgi:hypothetical protein
MSHTPALSQATAVMLSRAMTVRPPAMAYFTRMNQIRGNWNRILQAPAEKGVGRGRGAQMPSVYGNKQPKTVPHYQHTACSRFGTLPGLGLEVLTWQQSSGDNLLSASCI